MKYFIIFFLIVSAGLSRGQILPEHMYPYDMHGDLSIFDLFQIDSNSTKFVYFSGIDSILVFNSDHTFDRFIKVPELPPFGISNRWLLTYFGKGLYSTDGKFEYQLSTINSPGRYRIFNEDGTELFGCENCKIMKTVSTEHGTKMLVQYFDTSYTTTVFSVPGKLRTCNTKLDASNSSFAHPNNFFPTSSYPNPSSGQIHIEYKIPEGVSSGEIVISNDLGKEIRKFKVGSMFHDIVLQSSDLENGTYFYKVITDKGSSEAKKIVVAK